MKMAKASEADLKMALDLCQMLEGFERGHFPADEDAEDYEPFGAENAWQCLRAMELILDKLQEGSLSRVVYGMVVLLNPKNEAIDHSLDYLEHHPKVRMHDELVAALRVFVDKYNAAPDGELGIGLVNGDFLKARDILAKLEAR